VSDPSIRSATADDLPAIRDVFRRAALSNEGDRAWIEADPGEFGLDEANVPRIDLTANPHALAFYESVGIVEDGVAETSGGPAVRMHRDS
jgi:hypothetical protein